VVVVALDATVAGKFRLVTSRALLPGYEAESDFLGAQRVRVELLVSRDHIMR